MKKFGITLFSLLMIIIMLSHFGGVEASIYDNSTGLDYSIKSSEFSPGETIRVSVSSDGAEGNYWSFDRPSLSADGRFVAFTSIASNLVPNDTNDTYDVFVHDLQTRETTRVSVASDGSQAFDPNWSYQAGSIAPSISADGRFVAFESRANNLVPNDTSDPLQSNIFVHDRHTGETKMISKALDGTIGNDYSMFPSISADGRFVAYHSWATNLVPVEIINDFDVFVYDRQTGETTLVSVASDGTPGNDRSMISSISADGRYVVFESIATNLIEGETYDYWNVFRHDRLTGETSLVSVSIDGNPGNNNSTLASISADGRFVAFCSRATNLIENDNNNPGDIFVRDFQTGETTKVSLSLDGKGTNGYSISPAISADGRFVAFQSRANNLVPETDKLLFTNIYVHDRNTGKTKLVSVNSAGIQGNDESFSPSISADGRLVGFDSFASNLVPDDTNETLDIFVHYFKPDPFDPVQADFTAAPTSGSAPLVVNFTNQSTGDYDTCSWDFGDGNTSTDCDDPTHTYDSPGKYSVSLEVAGIGGEDTVTKMDYIQVYEPDSGYSIFLPLIQR